MTGIGTNRRIANNRLFCAGAFTIALATAGPAFAQEAPADEPQDQSSLEIVVTGFKHTETSGALKGDVPVRDIPLTISGYNEEFISDLEVAQVADLYNYMVGVQRSGTTGYDISIRGFSSGAADRNSILVDGLPGLAARFGSPPTINTASIEVVKGPASVLYGQVQPGGFVNIITKRPEADAAYEVGTRLLGYFGGGTSVDDTFGWLINGDLTGRLNESGTIAYRLVGEVKDQPGFVNFGYGHGLFVSPSISFEVGNSTTLLLQSEYRKETALLYDGLVAFNNDYRNIADIKTLYQEPTDRLHDSGYSGTITLDHAFSDSVHWHTAVRAVYHEDSYAGYRNNAFRNATTLRRQDREQYNVREYYFGDSNLSVEFAAGGVENKILLGANGGREIANFNRVRNDNNNITADINIQNPVYGVATHRPITGANWAYTTLDSFGFYLQDQLKFSERLKAVAAIRYEHFETTTENRLVAVPDQQVSGGRFSPMVGLIFQPNRQWSIYASYATSFNPPTPGAVDINGDVINQPELGSQIEGGIKAELANGKLNLTASVFDINKKNVIETIGVNVSALVGAERSRGGELEIDAQVTPDFKLIGGYAYIDADVHDDANAALLGLRLANSPKHSASIFGRYDIPAGPLEGLGFSLGVNYKSARFGTIPALGNRLVLPAYTVVDVGIYYETGPMSYSLQFKNVLDEKYYESASSAVRINPGAPASAVLSVRAKF